MLVRLSGAGRLVAGLSVAGLVLAPTTGAPALAADPSASPASVAAGTPVASAPSGAVLTMHQDDLDAALSATIGKAALAAYDEISAPGLIVGIETADGRWIGTIGTQDWGPGGSPGSIPMTPDVLQRIGSITKTFTVTALLQAVERGDLSLDEPIGDFVLGTPNPDATLGQLAAMRSGIPSYTFDQEFQDWIFGDPIAAWMPNQLVDIIRGKPADFAPGTQTAYSNTNTVLLGMALEAATGTPLPQLIDDGIITSLGLAHTTFPLDQQFAEPHAHGYTLQGQEPGTIADATDWNPSWGWAAGAMTSSLEDLFTYGKALVSGEGLLGKETQAARLDSFDFSIPPNSPSRAYGLGLGLSNGWYGHTGELPGYNTVLQRHPEAGITLVVMANSDIKAGDCPADAPALPGGPKAGPCEDPAVHVANAVSEALGLPLVAG
ncbi:MAG: serine hydrolase domain-containing protein [Chloroflexota bacterium]